MLRLQLRRGLGARLRSAADRIDPPMSRAGESQARAPEAGAPGSGPAARTATSLAHLDIAGAPAHWVARLREAGLEGPGDQPAGQPSARSAPDRAVRRSRARRPRMGRTGTASRARSSPDSPVDEATSRVGPPASSEPARPSAGGSEQPLPVGRPRRVDAPGHSRVAPPQDLRFADQAQESVAGAKRAAGGQPARGPRMMLPTPGVGVTAAGGVKTRGGRREPGGPPSPPDRSAHRPRLADAAAASDGAQQSSERPAGRPSLDELPEDGRQQTARPAGRLRLPAEAATEEAADTGHGDLEPRSRRFAGGQKSGGDGRASTAPADRWTVAADRRPPEMVRRVTGGAAVDSDGSRDESSAAAGFPTRGSQSDDRPVESAHRTAAADVGRPAPAQLPAEQWPATSPEDPWPALPPAPSTPVVVPSVLARDLARAQRLAQEQAAV